MAPLIEIVLPSYGVFACIGLFFSLILLFYRMNKFEIIIPTAGMLFGDRNNLSSDWK